MAVRLGWVLFCIGWFLSLNLIAQENSEEDLMASFGDEDFISIATGNKTLISKAPAVATVITDEDIMAMGAENLDQVLESVPGLHVSLSAARFSPVYQIRGVATNYNPQVLMLVNGMPLTQVFQGDRGINSTLPVRSIKRVEVIRGPGSAVYGADAFSGVINVITKSVDEIETSVGSRIASFGTAEVWLQHAEQLGNYRFAFSLEAFKADGDDNRLIGSDLQSFFDIFLPPPGVSYAPGAANTQQERLDLRMMLSTNNWALNFWNWRQNDIGTGPGIALALDPVGKSNVNNYMMDLTYDMQDVSSDWDIEFKTSIMDLGSDTYYILFPPGTVLPIGLDGNISATGGLPVLFLDGFIGAPAVYEKHFRFDTSAFYSGKEKHNVRLATGFQYVNLKPKEYKNFGQGVIDGTEGTVNGILTDVTNTPFIYIRDEDRTVYYASFQDEWSYAPDWTLTTGIRLDHYSDFGSTINPRLALVWNTRHNLTTKFLYGRAFRAPAFIELFGINNPVVLGNPALNPEVINTFEVAFDYRPSFDLKLGFNVFTYAIEDLIQFVPDTSGSSSSAQNVGKQNGKGFEIEFDWKLTHDLSLAGHYAYQDSTDETLNVAVANTPARKINLRSVWKMSPTWSMSLQGNHIADRLRQAGDPRTAIMDYNNIDLNIRKKINSGWSLSLGARNLLDKEQREPSPVNLDLPTGSAIVNDFPLESRKYYIEANFNFENEH